MSVPTPLIFLLGGLGVCLLLELLIPRTGTQPRRGKRWLNHGLLGIAGFGIGRVAGSAGLIGIAAWAQGQGLGLLPIFNLPDWLVWTSAILLLDLVLWSQHALFHLLPWLWPLHRLHHSDDALDVTTAWRFHPGEIMLSLGFKILAVITFGVPPLVVAVFEVLLAVSAAFNHAHIRLPVWLDRGLSMLIVTPDMHRVHHAKHDGMDRRNYGFFLNIWDRLFRTYHRETAQASDELVLGNDRVGPGLTLLDLLKQPFQGSK